MNTALTNANRVPTNNPQLTRSHHVHASHFDLGCRKPEIITVKMRVELLNFTLKNLLAENAQTVTFTF